MPSSVKVGTRPRIFWTRAYSSGVRPCSAANSAVTLISFSSTDDDLTGCATRLTHCGGLPRQVCVQGCNYGSEHDEPVGGIQRGLNGALRMGHHAHYVAF